MKIISSRWLARVALVAATAPSMFACADESSPPPPADVPDVGTDAAAEAAGDAEVDVDADAVADADAGNDDLPFVVPDVSVVCETTPCVTRLSGSQSGFCAVLADGSGRCWGANSYSRFGEGQPYSPTAIEGFTDIVEIAVSGQHRCLRTVDGSLHCTGPAPMILAGTTPPDGGGGPPPEYDISTPMRLDALPSAERVSLGDLYGCITTADGSVVCWGSNRFLELGRGPTEPWQPAPPEKVKHLEERAASLVGGDGRTFVITPEGAMVSWGANTNEGRQNFMLGRDTSEDPNPRPTLVPTLSRVRAIATSDYHSCAVAGRFVECWGSNEYGNLGRGNYGPSPSLPGRVVLPETADGDVPVDVSIGITSCAVLGSGRVYCWGGEVSERLLGGGASAPLRRGKPVLVEGFSGPVVALVVSGAACALLRTGAVECWGPNDFGQLGMGTTDSLPHLVPVRVNFSQ